MMVNSREIKKDIAKKSISAAKYTVIFKILSQITSLLVTVFLVRALSKHDYGIYHLFYSVISLLGMVASFGLANTLQRYIPEYYSRGEFRVANNLYRIASIIRLLSNVVILGLGLLLWEYLAPYLKIAAYKHYFILFTLIILLHMQRGLLETCLDSYFLQKYTQGFSFVFMFFKAIGYALALIMELNLWFILTIDLIAYSFIFSVLQIIYYKKIPASKGHLEQINTTDKKRLFRYAAFYNFNDTGVHILDASFDNFIIVMYLNPVAVGAYAFCQRICNIIRRSIPVNYLLNIIRPAFFSIGTDRDIKQINQFYQSLVKINYLFHIPIFFFIAILAEEIIKLFFGGKFIEYSHVLVAVYFFSILNAFQMPVGLVAQLKERADIILYSKIFAVYNLLADIIMIKYLGIWGAVFATGTAVLGKNIFIWFFVRKEASFKGMGSFFTVNVLFWLSVASAVFGLKCIISDSLLILVIALLVFTISFLLQFRLNLFNQYERKLIGFFSVKYNGLHQIVRLLGIQTT